MIATAEFGLVELDLLATHAGATIPFPLRVPSFGRIPGERAELFAAAGSTLSVRSLADEDGPLGVAAELVSALARRRGTVDLMLDGAGAVAVLHGSQAMLCRQRFGDELLVEVWPVAPEDLVDAVAGLVAMLPGAKTLPIRLPAAALRAAQAELAEGADEYRVRQIIASHGGELDDLDTLVAALAEVTGSGQLGATRTSAGTDARVGTELSWLDTPHGRLRVSASGPDGWVSVNPLRPNEVYAAIGELVELARG